MNFFTTTTPLATSASWDSSAVGGVPGHIVLANGAADIRGSVFADQAGTLNIEQSLDGVNWDVGTSITVSASTGVGFIETVVAPYIRLRYVNGGAGQGIFRLSGRLHSDDQSNG